MSFNPVAAGGSWVDVPSAFRDPVQNRILTAIFEVTIFEPAQFSQFVTTSTGPFRAFPDYGYMCWEYLEAPNRYLGMPMSIQMSDQATTPDIALARRQRILLVPRVGAQITVTFAEVRR